jgi:DNA-binding CsgD family transcriptional regulator
MTLHIFGNQPIISQSVLHVIKDVFPWSSETTFKIVSGHSKNTEPIQNQDLIIFLESSTYRFNIKWLQFFLGCKARTILIKDNLSVSSLNKFMTNGLKIAITTWDSELILRDAIKVAIENSQTYYSPILLSPMLTPKKRKVASSKPQQLFTPKETELLAQFWEGKTKWDIASDMNVSTRTIESYRSKLISRFNKDSFLEVIKLAVQNGILN